MWSKDRIISGHCQCCATFILGVQGTAATPRTEALDNVVLKYSISERAESIRIAKEFVRALGLSAPEVANIGNNSEQSFHWQLDNGKLALLFVDITRGADGWELYLNLSRRDK